MGRLLTKQHLCLTNTSVLQKLNVERKQTKTQNIEKWH